MTRRERVLDHLAVHPGLTTHEIAKVLDGGRGGQYLRLLKDMQRKGQLVRVDVVRDDREVTGWNIAPPGTRPVRIPDPDRERKRERDRRHKRRVRALARGEDPEAAVTRQPWRRLNLPVAASDWGDWRLKAECRGENPDLFFSSDPADIRKAQQVCAGCPVRLQCARAAEANGEQFGVWAGVDRDARHAELIAS
jgi:WhiB family transcriptional regulator, redox-sensing transcriptional regulator